MRTLEINPSIEHQLIDYTHVVNTDFPHKLIQAYALVRWLMGIARDGFDGPNREIARYQEDELLFEAQDVAAIPWALFEWRWEVNDVMMKLFQKEMQKQRMLMRTDKYFMDIPLLAMETSLRTQVLNLSVRHRPGQDFFSVLRSPVYHNCVLMSVLMWRNSEDAEPRVINQEQIVGWPTMWLYRVMHPECCKEVSRIALLMHSITSYAAKQMWPSLSAVEIAGPFPAMEKLLKEAAKTYGFYFRGVPPGEEEEEDIEEDDITYWYLSANDTNYTELWRRKWGTEATAGIRCSICDTRQARWTLRGYPDRAYCGNKCARIGWRITKK